MTELVKARKIPLFAALIRFAGRPGKERTGHGCHAHDTRFETAERLIELRQGVRMGLDVQIEHLHGQAVPQQDGRQAQEPQRRKIRSAREDGIHQKNIHGCVYFVLFVYFVCFV